MRDRFERQGKRIVSFVSWCGGLPAPEHSNVPLGMKFSWSPKGLLSAALNSARFKLAGRVIDIPGNELLESYFPDVPLAKGFALEGLANRDSLGYASTYGLGNVDGMRSLFRGTLR
jgi:alpha-aminoadipic semialdehyde synthase